MAIQPVSFSSNNHLVGKNKGKKPILTTANTGFMALGAMALTTSRALPCIKGKNPLKAHHKFLGCMTGALTLLHIGTAIKSAIHYRKSTKPIKMA